ncbi:MAG: RNA-binding protein [Parcubacteria group bacterium QH_9_35_7]|nr:MAG: RNA-binding protein [Parcubacteria group bacterium QH_9_35_7]
MQDDQEFLEYVVKKIVSHPEDVETSREVDERGVLLTLDVHPDDMGHVIGRDGQTARALRTLLKIVGAQNNARVNLKINEPEGSEAPSTGGNEEAASEDEDIDTSAVDDLDI